MKLLVLGATGGTGREIVRQALESSHEVTAYARDPARLSDLAALRVVRGNIVDGDQSLLDAMQGKDAVVSALGVGNSLRPHGLIARSMPGIVSAMERAGVRRLVFISAFGVGETRRDVPCLPRLAQRLLLREVFEDKAAGEKLLRASALDWTLVYPSILTDGPRTSKYRAGERLALRGLPTISRADVADFVMRQVGDATYVKKGVLVSC